MGRSENAEPPAQHQLVVGYAGATEPCALFQSAAAQRDERLVRGI
jgi:hypothetical protein